MILLLNWFAKGFLFTLGGGVAGMIVFALCIYLIVKLVKNTKADYNPTKLLESFKDYKASLVEDGKYEFLDLYSGEIDKIMQALENGDILDEVHTYNIEKKLDIELDEEKPNIGMVYVVLGKKK